MTTILPYVEHLTTLETSGWHIPAALTLPLPLAPSAAASGRRDGALPSAILLVPGSLFSDVNGDYPAWNSFPHVYAHLAHQLSARGHAVYRFAKLGPGTGSVEVDAEQSAAVRSWDGRTVIAAAALEALHRELAARHIRVERTIGAGHSEGAVVISRVALSDAGRELDGVVLLAGPSVGLLSIMREQAAVGTPPEELEAATQRLDAVIAHVRRGEPVPAALATGPGMGATALASMPDDARRYMRESDATDPRALAAALPQPVFVVQGGNDSSVPPHHAQALMEALRSRPTGSGAAEYLFVPGLTHMFKIVPPEVTGPEAFGYPGETDARVADGIDQWIRRLPS
jgi:fermentation-respiration switch protein FrsA (DUF1100 family)